MGIDLMTARFLTAAARRGVVGRELVMLGRQALMCSAADVLKTAWGREPTAQGVLPPHLKPADYAEDFFRWLGAEAVVSIDISSYEGAILVADLNKPIPAEWHGHYAAVFDGGTTEHIFDAAQAVRNIRDLLKPGGWLLSVVPGNNFVGHGFYQFSPEFLFRAYSCPAGFRRVAVFAAELTVQGEGRFYRVLDPAISGERGVFRNALPLLLYCLAQRSHNTAPAQAPMQSDYTKMWYKDKPKSERQSPQRKIRGDHFVRGLAVRMGLSWLKSILPMRWNPRCFQRINALEDAIGAFVASQPAEEEYKR